MSTRKPRGRVVRIFWLLAAVAMIVAVMPLAGAAAHQEDDPQIVDLIADGGSADTAVVVGKVQVWNDAHGLHVDYTITDDAWCLTKTQLDVAMDWEDIPQTKKHNPIPGHFEYSTDHNCVGEYGYVIPMTWDVGDPLAIAAHANVEIPALTGFELALPDQVSMVVAHPGGDSYFNTTVSGGSDLDGIYDGFCIDTDHTISPGATYTADVYSSYESLPGGTVEYPENLDLVNWVINQEFAGTDAGGGLDLYTYGDVQRAIWSLVEDGQSTSGLGPWSQARVDQIVAAAFASGEGFEPGCGDVVAVILVPVNGQQITIAQVTFANVEVPCEAREETAWGDGTRFGKQWGMWFDYEVQAGLFETILVPSDGSVVSSGDLIGGESYSLKASGTYRFANWGEAGIADAQCSLRKMPYIPASYKPDPVTGFAWVNGEDLGSMNYLEVWMGGDAFDWSPDTCASDHIYTGDVPGEGDPLEFFIPDSCSGEVLGCYGDNSGFITVEIWWMGNS